MIISPIFPPGISPDSWAESQELTTETTAETSGIELPLVQSESGF